MEHYFENREISWLGFNERVLQESADKRNPLFERLKFLGIFSNNRDEFFKVRVATYQRIIKLEQKKSVESGFRPEDVLLEIGQIVARQELRFDAIFNDLVLELAQNRIHMINEEELTPDQALFVEHFFHDNIESNLFPLILDSRKEVSQILRDGILYLVVEPEVAEESDDKLQVAVIEIPVPKTGRFIVLPKQGEDQYFILVEDVIRYCLSNLLSVLGYDKYNSYIIKFTRDGELDIDPDASKSFLELLSESVKKRRRASAVRFVYEKQMPSRLLKRLQKQLRLSDKDNFRGGGRYHNFKDFMDFPDLGIPAFSYQPQPSMSYSILIDESNFFNLLQKRDVMLHYPYQKFNYLIDFIREASFDPQVSHVYMTFYRAAPHSNVMNALINAARNDKSVSVFLELQARFDEEANINWITKLQEEGIKVYEPIRGFKVHSKLLLVNRKENGKDIFYSHISTGNFNESTAKVYADDSLFTADQRIGREVKKVFDTIESRFETPKFKHLIVSPFSTRKSIISYLDLEIENALNGKEAWVIFKMNSLVDGKVAKKLMQAAQAGVKVTLIIRGICVLKPDLSFPGYHNMELISVVGRYLEHSRIYAFANQGDTRLFMGSADMMPRNLDTRIEVLVPIFDPAIRDELLQMVKLQMSDNVKARYLDNERFNQYKIPLAGEPEINSQAEIYKLFAQKSTR